MMVAEQTPPAGLATNDPLDAASPDASFTVPAASMPAASISDSAGAGPVLDGRRVIALSGVGVVTLVVALGVSLYVVGPLVHDRDQRSLIATVRQAIAGAAHDNEGLYRETAPTQPPVPGATVGILTIPALRFQEVVVEGVGPSQTASAPGHVPGTAGIGQPGNAAVVGRRSAYGGPFGRLTELHPGDRIVAATTEGQSLYVVRSVRAVSLVTEDSISVPSVTTTTLGRSRSAHASTIDHSGYRSVGSASTPSTKGQPAVETTTALYGPSSDNQLTLVTSASSVPWNANQAVVVVARMQGLPFAPTPQESRSPSQEGNSGDPDALAWLLLALLALIAALIGAVALYRRATVRAAYLLTTVPLLALTVLAAEAASHLLPAWS